MEIYFDNSATTKCSQGVMELMQKAFLEDYGNPSSLHQKGMEAENYIRQARARIAKTLKVQEKELIFTSGGTEADNLAVIGAAMANRRFGKHLITTKIEHPAVAAPMHFLEEQGFEVTWLDVDRQGRICLKQLEEALRPDTILVSIMYVNNEIGTLEPVEEAARIVKEKNPRALFHTDAIQAYGKYQIYPGRMGIDLLSASGHKIHGPKGVGFLYKREKVKLSPILFGGGHQWGMRSGTENVPGIAGLGQAAMEAYEDLLGKQEHLLKLREHFLQGLEGVEWAHVNGSLSQEEGAYHIVSVSFDKVRSEVLLHALEERGIYVSAGSACSSNKPAVSETLKNIGLDQAHLGSTLRFSFSIYNTQEEVDRCIKALKELVPVLARYTRH
ncbi:MAG: cysteine desulfurase [Lachnospiraceae bacterium]|nr:cysteine desulfurase [Lachnospiraceae bacterium]